MLYCGKCGTQINDNIKFCPKCGNKIENKINYVSFKEKNINKPKKREFNGQEIAIISIVIPVISVAFLIIFAFLCLIQPDDNRGYAVVVYLGKLFSILFSLPPILSILSILSIILYERAYKRKYYLSKFRTFLNIVNSVIFAISITITITDIFFIILALVKKK